MNFVVEFLPKREKSEEFVFVVRAQNGFPLQVCDDLNDVIKVMKSKFDELRKSMKSDS